MRGAGDELVLLQQQLQLGGSQLGLQAGEEGLDLGAEWREETECGWNGERLPGSVGE